MPLLQQEYIRRRSRSHRRLGGNRLRTLLGSSSGQSSRLVSPQASRRSR